MSSIISKLLNLAGNITGTLPVVNGGTGVTTSTGTGSTVLNNAPNLIAPVIEDSGDTTKHVIFAAGAAATSTSTTLAFQQSANRIVFFPDASAALLYSGGPLGTPSSGNLSTCTSYPDVTQSTAGLVSSAGQLLGTNTNDTASAGNVGEAITTTVNTNSPNQATPTGGTNYDVASSSITVTAGDWDIFYTAPVQAQISGTIGQQAIGILSLMSGTSSGSPVAQQVGCYLEIQVASTTITNMTSVTGYYRAQVATSTSYHLAVSVTNGAGPPTFVNITARGDQGGGNLTSIKAVRRR